MNGISIFVLAAFLVMMAYVIAIIAALTARVGRQGSGTVVDKGAEGERVVRIRLSDLDPSLYIVMNDIWLRDRHGNTTQIDHVVVSRFGLFCVETKNYSGWVFGDAYNARWTVMYNRHTKVSVQNPIRQNHAHRMALSATAGVHVDNVIPVVAFLGNAEFPKGIPPGEVFQNHPLREILQIKGC